ncbi:MAG: DUF6076 domain-containing protein [Syntrophobacterales bacterium]|nr:DUF6076 domain-containing protein [Syntrophobacterales bacterium]
MRLKFVGHEVGKSSIKKCKNCKRFFIPRRMVNTEYCEHLYGDRNKKRNEIGTMNDPNRKGNGGSHSRSA